MLVQEWLVKGVPRAKIKKGLGIGKLLMPDGMNKHHHDNKELEGTSG